jgi:hypothetical protein
MAKGPLFPELPEDLASLSDADLEKLREEHKAAITSIQEDDPEFLGDMDANEIIAQLETGVAQLKALDARASEREAEFEAFNARKAELLSELEDKPEVETEEIVAEVTAEDEGAGESDGAVVEEEKGEERELVLASAETPAPRYARTPPAPRAERIAEPTVVVAQTGTSLVASAAYAPDYAGPLDPIGFARLQKQACDEHGPAQKTERRGAYRTQGPHGSVIWDGPRVKTAKASFDFPGDRTLSGGEDDLEKIRAVMPATTQFLGQAGGHGGEALTASGGLCAPLTPIYTMPNFATEAEPVWDSLPVFRAARGGVNVPTATYIADITSAISSISEEDDALGGTFATKSCQALECPDYTETAVQILAHCREYGNLNARAWPEKIAHENALTMAALSRTSEGFMLDRIKALSVNVTNGAETLGALIYLVDGITKAMWGIRGRLRMSRDARFRVLLPVVLEDIMALDTVSTQFDRYRSKEAFVAYLRSIGVDPVFYIDTPSTDDSQLPDAEQTAAALDGFPNTIQWAIYPEGAFIGVDMGTLELGIVRDSVLNSTNDFQVFGERFRNVALLAPQQAAYWVTTDLCPTGQFPPAGTARTCE